MLRALLICSVSFSLILSPVASAEDLPSDTISELELVSSIEAGESAPFSGTLFSTAAAAKLLAELELNDTQCQLEIEKELELANSRHQLEVDNLSTRILSIETSTTKQLEIKENHIDFLDQQLEKSARPRNELWFAAGVVGGVLLTGAAAWSMGQISHTH